MMTVTVCVVARNEETTLPGLLEDIKNQTYAKDKMEILLIDSMSDDKTRTIMNDFAECNSEYRRVEVLVNQKGNLAAGWNVALRNFTQEVIIRIDAHARIPSDFVWKNVECLEKGEDICGGQRPSLPEKETGWQDVLLQAENSMFGSSISDFRRGKKKKYVKSLFHAAYRRKVFEEVGEYNEELGRTEDNEMHYRMRKAGYKLCFDPEICSWQYTRNSLRGMAKQKFGNGYWVALTLGVCPKCLSVYYFVPFAFLLGIIFTTLRAVLGKPKLAVLMWAAYLITAVGMTYMAVRDKARHIFQIFIPGIFLILHISYGVGSLAGMIKLVMCKLNRAGKDNR